MNLRKVPASNSSLLALQQRGLKIVRSADGIATTDAERALWPDESEVAYDDLTAAERRDLHGILFPRY